MRYRVFAFVVALASVAAGPAGERFRFDSGGAHHIEGFGAWRVAVDREGNLAIEHQVRDEVRTLPPARLPEDEATALWRLIDAAGLAKSRAPSRPGVPDEPQFTFAVEKAGSPAVEAKLWEGELADSPGLAAVARAVAALIEKRAGEKPVFSLPPPPPPEIVAGAWLADGAALTALYLSPDAGGPVPVHLALASDRREDPGDYGVFPPEAFKTVDLAPGAVTLARLDLGGKPASSLIVLREKPSAAVDVHGILDGGEPAGTVLFTGLSTGGDITLSRHLAMAGDVVEAVLKAPDSRDFFREETLEIACVARRLGLSGGEADGPRGCVAVEWVPSADAVLLEGEAGEKRIRSHFENPKCPWAERHVGWLAECFVIEYSKPADLTFRLDTSGVKAAGRVSDTRRGFSAFGTESIWPNGFGGTSSGGSLPSLLVVPKGTPIREVSLR